MAKSKNQRSRKLAKHKKVIAEVSRRVTDGKGNVIKTLYNLYQQV